MIHIQKRLDTEACVDPLRVCPSLGRSFQANHGWFQIIKFININHMSIFLGFVSEMLSRSFKHMHRWVHQCQTSGNLDLEQLLIIMYITGWDQHVLILFLCGCWNGLCQHAETQGREMPQKLWMLKPGFLFTTTATSSCTGIGLLVRTGRVVIGLPVFLSS